MMSRIHDVTEVQLELQKSNPPTINIIAKGRVASAGWHEPRLEPWIYIAPPSDGIQDFDFVATPPSGNQIQVFRPIEAQGRLSRGPEDYWGKDHPLVGVRIHALENKMEARFGDSNTLTIAADARRILLPGWSGSGEGPDYIGMTLRVYQTGDPVTDDYLLDRLNIELDPRTRRIVAVKIG
ncbi:hypothetical protein [Dongia sp.]|uniref:hypothetical protein n=1 Tax=Dongia sp. TaxID=1977262 RepID=UPI0035B149A7